MILNFNNDWIQNLGLVLVSSLGHVAGLGWCGFNDTAVSHELHQWRPSTSVLYFFLLQNNTEEEVPSTCK